MKGLKSKKSLFFALLLLVIPFFCKGQADKNLTDSLFQHAIELIKKENYAEAEITFKKIFSQNSVLPDELAFFYGKTLFHLNKLPQSRSALDKYTELKGKSGEYYSETTDLIRKIDCKETGLATVEEACHVCEGTGVALAPCKHCRGKGKEMCNVCQGSGVYRKQGPLGTLYQTCNKCAGKGMTNCKICNGKKEQKAHCNHCSATGFLKLKVPCD